MSPIAWIVCLLAVCALFFAVKRNSRNFAHSRRTKELTQENSRLRQAVFDLSMDKHDDDHRARR